MIVYRDMTFCTRGEGCTCDPHRRLTDEVRAAAKKMGLPLSLGVLCKPLAGEDAKR